MRWLIASCLLLSACGTKSKENASAAPAADPNTVVVGDAGLLLGGARLGDVPPDTMRKVDPLLAALKERREAWIMAHPGGTFAGALTVELAPNIPCNAALSVYETAAGAGHTQITWKQGSTTLAVTSTLKVSPPQPEERAPAYRPEAFAQFGADGNATLKPLRCGGAYDVVPAASLPATVKEWCKDKADCPGALRIRCDAGVPMAKVLPVLAEVQKASAGMELGYMATCKEGEDAVMGPPESVEVEIAELFPMLGGASPRKDEPSPPLPSGKQKPMGELHIGQLTMAGALTEAEVRMPMMNRHPDVMACYSRALERNPNLMGRVTVRLEIGKKGAIMVAGNGGSDLPDMDVVRCVIRAASTATFPAKGASTTLLYPMMMSPLSQK